MNILDIYQKYQIMPQLAEHQLRVAAVADMVCDHIDIPVNKRDVVTACLLHDMGNIIKFDLHKTNHLYPELFISGDVLPRWTEVKRQFREKYGNDEHEATVKIARELGVSSRAVELIDSVGFEQGIKTAAGSDWEKRICEYGDSRVAPYGVTSLDERLADGSRRYNGTENFPPDSPVMIFNRAMHKIERDLFRYMSIRPEDITEQAIAERKKRLENFAIAGT